MTASNDDAPRLVKPRLMMAAGTTLAVGLFAAAPVAYAMSGKMAAGGADGLSAPAWVVLAASEVGEGGEGGEGGEAGVAETETDDVAYLTGLGLIEGEVRAAVAMYDAGEKDIAESYMYRPGEDILDQLKPGFEARGAAGLDGELADLTSAASGAGDSARLKAAFDKFVSAADAAGSKVAGGDKARLGAITQLVRHAAKEYGDAYEEGAIENEAEYHHAWGFAQVARRMAEQLKTSSDATVAAAAATALEQIAEIEPAWPAMKAPDKPPVDPSVLFGAAARIDIAALKVK